MVRPLLGRLTAVVLLSGCAGLLAAGAVLRPDPRGYGTHEQVGLSPCPLPLYFRLPCPSCGMSTAFALTVRGRWLRAAYTQPMGWLLCVAVLTAVPFLAWSAWRGRVVELNWYRVRPAPLVLGVLFLFLAAWAFKVFSGLLDGDWTAG